MQNFKIYKLRDFIRKNESGELSYERLKEIVRELAFIAALHRGHNILLDFRKTTISEYNMVDILKIAMEVGKFRHVLDQKIANVVPKDKERVVNAQKSETAIQCEGIQYRYFTDFENAIEWLSEIT
jgi:hypothetical protein